jgi:Ser-tRNA(Ala) deacylase AlaX
MPRLEERRDFEDVPAHIAEAASEATLCLSVGAFRAAGALARAVIEATAKDKGAEGKTLEKRIDALRDADHIRKHTREQAHEIRHFGNDMAHGDFVELVTEEEAEEVVELMTEVLDEVYQSPARLLKRKTARLAKKGEAEGS